MEINTSNLPKIIESKSGRYIIFSEKDHISEHIMKHGAWEEHSFQILCSLLDNKLGDFLDIGANMGALSIPLARVYPKRKFYCFEAQRQVYQQLCGNAVLNATTNIYPYHMAIGNPQGQGETISVPVPDYFRDANIGSVTLDKRIDLANGWTYDAYENVALLKIDDLGLANIGVIKIDVEGMELDVLRGMKETLMRCNYPSILFEIWRDEKYDWVEAEKNEIVKFLKELDYRVDLFPSVTTGMAQHKDTPQLIIEIETKPR